MQPPASAERAAGQHVDSTIRPRRHRKQPEHYAKLTPSHEIPSDCELDVEDTDTSVSTAESESDTCTSRDSNVSDQDPWADSSDEEQSQEGPGPRSKRRSTAAAAAVQPTSSKRAKVAQPEAPQTASNKPGRWRKRGRCASRVTSLPDGGKAVETAIASFVSCNFIKLPWAFAIECFPNPPNDVHLKAIVDGQLADLGAALGHVRRCTRSSGRTLYNLFYKKGLWSSYTGHVITKLSTNSISSELTLHLMSPAGRQAGTVAEAAAIAAAAAAGETYWYEQQGTDWTLDPQGRVHLPLPLLRKVFGQAALTLTPGSDPDTPVMVVVSIYRDTELASRTSQPLIHGQRRMIYVPPKVRRQLAGFKLMRFRAAKPNLLEVYFSSEDAQEPAAVPVAPVPPSASPSQSAAAQVNIQQAGTPAAGFAAGRMPSATAALTEQQTSSTPTPRASTASAIAAARAGSSAGLFGLRDGGLAAGRSGAAAASSAEKTADAAAATAVAHSNKSSRRSIQLAAAGAMPKAAAAAGVPDTRSSARAIGAEGAAAATRRPGTPAVTTPAQQTRKQVQKHVTFDLPAANCGTAVSGNKTAGTGFGSHDRPELNTSTAAAANTAASKSPVVTACLQTPPQSAPKGRAEFYSTAARRASRDSVQGSAAKSSTKRRAKSLLQEQQQLGIQQQTATTAAASIIDLTLGSDEEAEELPVSNLPQQAAPAAPATLGLKLEAHPAVHTKPGRCLCKLPQQPTTGLVLQDSQQASACNPSEVCRWRFSSLYCCLRR